MARAVREIAVVFLHPGCNLRCPFCATDGAMDTMTFGEAVAVLDRLRGSGVRNVVLGGGEPFTWPGDVVRLATEARGRGFLVQVGTNGVALPVRFAELPQIDRYVLPLDAAEPAIHNAMRPHGMGHHSIVLDRLAALRSARRPVTISTVVTAPNIGQLESLADYLAAYAGAGGAVHAWHLYKFMPVGRGGAASAERFAMEDCAYHERCRRIQGLGLPFRVYRRPDMYHSRDVDFVWRQNGAVCVGSQQWTRTAGEAA